MHKYIAVKTNFIDTKRRGCKLRVGKYEVGNR